MSKVKKITVSNLKAISQQVANFDGCTAIVTGANNSGKTTLLRSLFDRCRTNGIKADKVLKDGESEGFNEIELTTGEKLRWEFNDKGKGFKEKLTYITEKDIKTSLTSELRARFLPETFDVDAFLAATPQKQRKVLQDLAGLDFTDIDTRYSEAYKERTAANTRAADAATLLNATVMPVKAAVVEIGPLNEKKEKVRGELNQKYLDNKAANEITRNSWQMDCDLARNTVIDFNKIQKEKLYAIQHIEGYRDRILNIMVEVDGLSELVDLTKLIEFITNMPQPEPDKIYVPVPEPEYIPELPDNTPLLDIETKIDAAHEQNRKAALYSSWLEFQKKKDETAKAAIEANNKVTAIEAERMDLIKTANMPEGFTFTDEGIAYNGLSFTREQLSSSGIYIAALKLASMNIGEIRTLHFDASFLDKNSLAEIEQWASANDLQLLIERPDFEGGEIEYQLITED